MRGGECRFVREELHMYRRDGDISWESTEAGAGASEAPGASGAGSAAGASSASVGVAERPFSLRRRDRRITSKRKVASLPGDLLPTMRLNGVKLHAVTEQQCINHILDE